MTVWGAVLGLVTTLLVPLLKVLMERLTAIEETADETKKRHLEELAGALQTRDATDVARVFAEHDRLLRNRAVLSAPRPPGPSFGGHDRATGIGDAGRVGGDRRVVVPKAGVRTVDPRSAGRVSRRARRLTSR